MHWVGRVVFTAMTLFVVGRCATIPQRNDLFPPSGDATGRMELPALRSGDTVIRHTGFALVYSPKKRVPVWVAYTLTPQRATQKVTARKDHFLVDKNAENCAAPDEYYKSGYDRGHMVPAEDTRWSVQAMQDSFYMSNMTPQKHRFNGGIWKALETRVREWAQQGDELFIASGPVLQDGCKAFIGNKICVPARFFKVLLARQSHNWRAIGFLIPHDFSDKNLSSYVASVDAVESATGLDFFPVLDDEMETRVEASRDFTAWLSNPSKAISRTR